MEMNSFTSLKLRSAWIPPAVAHAPMVTRNLEARRMPWMRSASCGVVMEPSTSAGEASGKFAISTAPATASSSSSQSSRLNWHPSHEENFQTASLGLRNAISDLRLAKNGRDAGQREYRAVLADKGGTVLAMAAKADAAFHVAFRRQINALRRHAALQQLHHGKAHHDLGPAKHCQGVGRIERRATDHGGHHTDIAAPGAGGAIDRHLNFQVKLAAPAFQLVTVQHVLGSARAIQQNDPAKLAAFRHQAVECGPQGSQPDSACHNHDIAAGRFLHRS